MVTTVKFLNVSQDEDHLYVINKRPVDDITFDLFNKPHTSTLLTTVSPLLLNSAFTRNNEEFRENLWAGVRCVIFLFVVIVVLAFPNGPLTSGCLDHGLWTLSSVNNYLSGKLL